MLYGPQRLMLYAAPPMICALHSPPRCMLHSPHDVCSKFPTVDALRPPPMYALNSLRCMPHASPLRCMLYAVPHGVCCKPSTMYVLYPRRCMHYAPLRCMFYTLSPRCMLYSMPPPHNVCLLYAPPYDVCSMPYPTWPPLCDGSDMFSCEVLFSRVVAVAGVGHAFSCDGPDTISPVMALTCFLMWWP